MKSYGKGGGLSTTMQSGAREVAGPEPDVRGADMSGDKAPFNKPHSTGPCTIPTVFRQSNIHGEAEAAQVSSTMGSRK